jgi:FG-GAP repeat
VPREDLEPTEDAGVVNVIYGSSAGLTELGNRIWHQDSPGIPSYAEPDDWFGYSLAAADLGGTAEAELAVGVRSEDVGSVESAGEVSVIYGSPEGLAATGARDWHQNTSGVPGIAEPYDFFGSALAAANFGKEEHADLAVGAPAEDAGAAAAGSVNVLYGSASGVSASGAELWYQGTVGVQGDPEVADIFGDALAGGDFDGDGFVDLAVGVPGENQEQVGPDDSAVGAVNALFGNSAGLNATGDQFIWQDSSAEIDGAVEGESEGYDFFGAALAAADFGRGGSRGRPRSRRTRRREGGHIRSTR